MVRSRERGSEQSDHGFVSSNAHTAVHECELTTFRSAVLWVAQNVEDDYQYNLAL